MSNEADYQRQKQLLEQQAALDLEIKNVRLSNSYGATSAVHDFGGSKPAETLIDTLKDRGEKYGDFAIQAVIVQALKSVMYMHGMRSGKLKAHQIEALEMIAHKIGRILNGDPNYADSWIDIAGYAKLVADRCETK